MPAGVPVPGQEFIEPGLRRLCDPVEDVGEPGGADQGVHRCGADTAAVGAGEHPKDRRQNRTLVDDFQQLQPDALGLLAVSPSGLPV